MDLAICVGFSTVTAFLVALGISGYRTFSLGRRCHKIELLVGDVLDRQNTVKGRKAADARWSDEKWLKELEKGSPQVQPARTRYDNDPIGT